MVKTTEAGAAAPPAAAKKVHLAFLDGLRACAALYIVCHHAMIFGTVDYLGVKNGQDSWRGYPETSAHPVAYLISWLFHSFGQDSVAVFICLSGFCLMIPVVRNRNIRDVRVDAIPFLIKRAKRILPPYYASIAFSLLMIATLIGTPTQGVWDFCLSHDPNHIVNRFDLISHLLLIHDLFHPANGRINGVLWSVAAEWRIYFLFPVMIWSWKRFGPMTTVIAALVAAALSHPILPRIFHHFHVPIHVEPTMFVPEYGALFALGALAAGISLTSSPRIVALRSRLPWGLLAFVPLLADVIARFPLGGDVIVLTHLPDRFNSSALLTNLLVGIGTSALMAGLTVGRWSWLRGVLGCRPLVFAGTISYSLYLTHYPIEQALLHYVIMPMGHSRQVDGLLMIPLAFPITIAFAYLFYRAVEKPSHLWATRRGASDKLMASSAGLALDTPAAVANQ